jgi:hypothetical protein
VEKIPTLGTGKLDWQSIRVLASGFDTSG